MVSTGYCRQYLKGGIHHYFFEKKINWKSRHGLKVLALHAGTERQKAMIFKPLFSWKQRLRPLLRYIFRELYFAVLHRLII